MLWHPLASTVRPDRAFDELKGLEVILIVPILY